MALKVTFPHQKTREGSDAEKTTALVEGPNGLRFEIKGIASKRAVFWDRSRSRCYLIARYDSSQGYSFVYQVTQKGPLKRARVRWIQGIKVIPGGIRVGQPEGIPDKKLRAKDFKLVRNKRKPPKARTSFSRIKAPKVPSGKSNGWIFASYRMIYFCDSESDLYDNSPEVTDGKLRKGYSVGKSGGWVSAVCDADIYWIRLSKKRKFDVEKPSERIFRFSLEVPSGIILVGNGDDFTHAPKKLIALRLGPGSYDVRVYGHNLGKEPPEGKKEKETERLYGKSVNYEGYEFDFAPKSN